MSHEVHRFQIDPIERFAKQSGVRQPVELASFSFDARRQLHHDDSSLAYYWPISHPGVSLSTGFEQLTSRDESIDEHLDALLESLIHYESKHGSSKTSVDIVTWRGMVTKFLTCPYARKDGFEMNVTRLGNTVFMEEHVSPQARAEKIKRESDPRQSLMGYWGYKYEALATMSRIWHETSRHEIENRESNLVNTNVQYCSVVRTRLGPVSMILGGEVDCCKDYKPSHEPESTTKSVPDAVKDNVDDYGGMRPPSRPLRPESIVDHYIELKTSKVHRSERDRTNFERFKLLKFWAQSFLLGIPEIIVGYRDDEGRLLEESSLATLRIPSIVRAGSGAWDGNVCLNFAGEALQFVKQTVMQHAGGGGGGGVGADEDGGGVWRLRYQPGSGSLDMYRVQEGGYGFLTEAYVQHKRGGPPI